MDEEKIAIIIYRQEDASYQRLMEQLATLEIPEIHGRQAGVEVVTMEGDGGGAAA